MNRNASALSTPQRSSGTEVLDRGSGSDRDDAAGPNLPRHPAGLSGRDDNDARLSRARPGRRLYALK
jgi:hypothetical protein